MPRGPLGHPVLGNALSLSRGRFEFLRACAREYGDLVPLRFFRTPVLFVNRPDYIEQVLATNHRKVIKNLARVDYALVGDGVSLSEGADWLRERRLMQPSFHATRIAAYGDVMVGLAEWLTESWRDGEAREICSDMTELTVAIVARTLFGVDVRKDAVELSKAMAFALDCREQRLRRQLELLLPPGLPTPTKLRLDHARRRIDRIVYRMIEERRAAGDPPDAVGDLLSVLLHARDEQGQGLTDRQIRNEVLTIFVGGSDTVVDLLAWIWYLLSQNPGVESKLLAELDATLGGRSPTDADLPRLPYATMIVSEALRLYPPAPALGREAIADFDIGDYHVRKGTHLLVSQWVMHRDPRYFADSDAFNPDRWADGLASRLPRYAYFPFGGGPRLCIGKSFATTEAILVLAAIAQRYRLELLPGHRVVAEAIPSLRPKFGLPMVVHRRHRNQAPR
jgi:cytochrome P450